MLTRASFPDLVDHAIRAPVILTRTGPDAFGFLPAGACSRPRARAPRPPAIDAQNNPGS